MLRAAAHWSNSSSPLLAMALLLASGMLGRCVAQEVPTPAQLPSKGIRARLGRGIGNALRKANPKEFYRTARTNARNGRFYAIDFTEHGTRKAAMARSVRPLSLKTNVMATIRRNAYPLRLAGAVIGPLGVAVQRELATTGEINPGRLLRHVEPGPILGGMAASFAGDALGAAAHSALAASMGPAGAVVGLLFRPFIGYGCFLVGANFGRGVQNGTPSFKGAVAESLLQIDPARDGGCLIGSTIGSVVGQALIPVPVVGAIIGGLVGGVVGGLVGHLLGTNGITADINSTIKGWFSSLADSLLGNEEKPDPAAKPKGSESASIDGPRLHGPALSRQGPSEDLPTKSSGETLLGQTF